MNKTLEEQRRLTTMSILWTSIALSAVCIAVGLAIFLAHGGDYAPQTPAGSLVAIFAFVWDEGRGMHASAFLEAGMLVILFTPLARLTAGVVANLRSRDWTYVTIGLVVVALVVLGMLSGQSGS